MTEKERLAALLFSDSERELIDLKFFRGSDAVITDDEVCAEINRSLEEVRSGRSAAVEHIDRGQLVKKSFAHLLS